MQIPNLMKRSIVLSGAVLLTVLSATSHAATPQSFLEGYAQEAKAQNPAFKGFSVKAGESFYKQTHGGDWSCSSCHTDNPTAVAKVNKWFKRNCNDVLKRECTAEEKGNLLTYLLSAKP